MMVGYTRRQLKQNSINEHVLARLETMDQRLLDTQNILLQIQSLQLA